MPFRISYTDKFRTSFNGQSVHLEEWRTVRPPLSGNRPSAFTYAELTAIYGTIKPYRNKSQIADIREDLVTHYDANYRPTNKIIGTIQGMRENITGPVVFYITKQAEPGHMSLYKGGLYKTSDYDREEFETVNFDRAIRMLKAHLQAEHVFAGATPAPVL